MDKMFLVVEGISGLHEDSFFNVNTDSDSPLAHIVNKGTLQAKPHVSAQDHHRLVPGEQGDNATGVGRGGHFSELFVLSDVFLDNIRGRD